MQARPDISVYAPDNTLKMVVEVKYRRGANQQWASHFRRNLLAHSQLPPADYFLLVLPEWAYLWRDELGLEAPPTLQISTDEIVGTSTSGKAPVPADEQTLELAVKGWLNAVTSMTREAATQRYHWVVTSGIFDGIRGGHVEYQPAA
jgi:hypothetical protein